MYEIQPHTSFRTLLNGFTMNSAGNGNAEVEAREEDQEGALAAADPPLAQQVVGQRRSCIVQALSE